MIASTAPDPASGREARVQLMGLLTAADVGRALFVAAELGIADELADGGQTAEELAVRTGCDADALARVLRLLCVEGIFGVDESGRFELAGPGRLLRTDAAGSLRAHTRFAGATWRSRAWDELLRAVRTGRPSFPEIFGMPLFEYLAQHPEAEAVFEEHLAKASRFRNMAVARSLTVEGSSTVVDVGGGSGALLTLLLEREPTARGILFDLAAVAGSARVLLDDRGLVDRCEVAIGSFFDQIPSGGDLYLLCWVLHDWNDDDARRILQSCRRSMSDGARLVIVEELLRLDASPQPAKALDVEMLVLLGGRERTESEYAELLGECGFRLHGVIATASPAALIESRPV